MEAQYICRYHRHQPSEHQCSSSVVKHIKAPVDIVWSLVRRFDQPQKYKPFVSQCIVQGDLNVGSVREVNVKSGLPATTSTERLELLDDQQHILGVKFVGGDHRLKNKYEELKSSKLAEGVVEKDIDDSALFYEASGVKNNRGRSYGCGSEAVFFESSSSRYTRFKTTHSTDPAVQDLQSRLTDVESQLAELRGLFEKMDGAFFRHGGSSSGVPRPCDDENEINPIGDDIEDDDD